MYLDVLPYAVHPSEADPPAPEPQSTFKLVRDNLYRFVFAGAFWVQWRVSKLLAALVLLLGYAILILLCSTPGGWLDGKLFLQRQACKDCSNNGIFRLLYMTYPYYHIISGACTSGKKVWEVLSHFHLPRIDQVPVLYLYGVDKTAQFHDQNVVDWLEAKGQRRRLRDDDNNGSDDDVTTNKSNCIAVANAAHWLHAQQEDVCFDAIQTFLCEK